MPRGDPSNRFVDSPISCSGCRSPTTSIRRCAKSYLRDNVFDAYATDDWRVLPSLTLNYGLRYEYFAPYTEKYGRLADVDTNPDAAFTQQPR